jgi:hypothetical protein
MDWGLTANIAVVVVPTVGFVGYVLDLRIKTAILENNATLIKQINGTYVRKESFEPWRTKVDTDMSNMTASIARAYRPGGSGR